MNLEIFVQPETVSFSGIAMEEIPSTTEIHVSRGTNGVIRLNGNAVQGVMVTQEELNEVFGNN